eukprot:CAMPEP_0119204222 /NCGR_PEP_ID=MMETSP1316-20130426/36761_1 /TAXON_ID=41880 /ORGANISM="Pycnococcus provasolii, Strain RCC2336" /LENGTH=125 /DNA_ID=CAMNT_0007200523 /DNA_START=243 /DNA_END=620 /DNA_ORIENTATION=-
MIHFLLNRPCGDESVDCDILRLADAPCTFSSLDVSARIPVRVKDDDAVSSNQVGSQSTHARREQEQKYSRVGGIEFRHQTSTAVDRRRPIHAAILKGFTVLLKHVPLNDVKHLLRLREDEATVSF